MKLKNQDLFLISLIILLSVIAWIAVDLAHIANTKKYSTDYQKSMNLKIKSLNLETIKKLNKRQ